MAGCPPETNIGENVMNCDTFDAPDSRMERLTFRAGHVLAGVAFIDQPPGVVDLLRRKLRSPAKFHASALRSLHPGAGAF